MTLLPSSLVGRISDHVTSSGLSGPLAEELTDHLCCLTEDALATGQSVEEALSVTLAKWPANRLRSINRQVNYTTKLKPMLLKLIPVAAVCSGILLLSPFSSPEVTVTPCSQELEEYVLSSPAFDPPTRSPIPGVDMEAILSSGFGMRMHPMKKVKMLHNGIDLKAKIGTPVVATADGTVSFAADNGRNGLMVTIEHQDGYSTSYKHLQGYVVKVGEVVEAGKKIGTVGNTGASTAPHLHYEVLKENKPVDPLALRE